MPLIIRQPIWLNLISYIRQETLIISNFLASSLLISPNNLNLPLFHILCYCSSSHLRHGYFQPELNSVLLLIHTASVICCWERQQIKYINSNAWVSWDVRRKCVVTVTKSQVLSCDFFSQLENLCLDMKNNCLITRERGRKRYTINRKAQQRRIVTHAVGKSNRERIEDYVCVTFQFSSPSPCLSRTTNKIGCANENIAFSFTIFHPLSNNH